MIRSGMRGGGGKVMTLEGGVQRRRRDRGNQDGCFVKGGEGGRTGGGLAPLRPWYGGGNPLLYPGKKKNRAEKRIAGGVLIAQERKKLKDALPEKKKKRWQRGLTHWR